MTKKLTKAPVVKPDTEIVNIDADQVKNLVANHLEVVTTILDTYEDLLDVLDDGVKTELLASVDNLTNAIDSIPEATYEFDKLMEKLEALDDRNVEDERLLAICDEDEILDWVKTNKPGYVLVKVDSPDIEAKIRNYLETEIYPFYNDQVNNILF